MTLHSELYTINGFILVLMLDVSLAFMIICYCTVHLEKQLVCDWKQHKPLSFDMCKNYLVKGKIITELLQ